MYSSTITIQHFTVTNRNSLKIACGDGIFAYMSFDFTLNRYDPSFFIKYAHRILSSGYAVIRVCSRYYREITRRSILFIRISASSHSLYLFSALTVVSSEQLPQFNNMHKFIGLKLYIFSYSIAFLCFSFMDKCRIMTMSTI